MKPFDGSNIRQVNPISNIPSLVASNTSVTLATTPACSS
jgi:hypothetical protein